jgi:hypothetical protein
MLRVRAGRSWRLVWVVVARFTFRACGVVDSYALLPPRILPVGSFLSYCRGINTVPVPVPVSRLVARKSAVGGVVLSVGRC